MRPISWGVRPASRIASTIARAPPGVPVSTSVGMSAWTTNALTSAFGNRTSETSGTGRRIMRLLGVPSGSVVPQRVDQLALVHLRAARDADLLGLLLELLLGLVLVLGGLPAALAGGVA